MTSIVMLVRDRYRLTKQCLDSLYWNTPREQFNLTVVNDGSGDFRVRMLLDSIARANTCIITVGNSRHCLAGLRNLGAAYSKSIHGRGDYILFSDNDTCFLTGWLENMTRLLREDEDEFTILGGCQHPYHRSADVSPFREVDAVAGYSMMMHWNVWEQIGPFRGTASGIGQSEDWDFCQRAKQQGVKVGYIHPPVVAHCGITNSNGEPAPGHELFWRAPGVIYE